MLLYSAVDDIVDGGRVVKDQPAFGDHRDRGEESWEEQLLHRPLIGEWMEFLSRCLLYLFYNHVTEEVRIEKLHIFKYLV